MGTRNKFSRREIIQAISGAGAMLGRAAYGENTPLRVAGSAVEIAIAPVSDRTVRISLLPLVEGRPQPVPEIGSLVPAALVKPQSRVRNLPRTRTVKAGSFALKLSSNPLAIRIERRGHPVQELRIDESTGAVRFQRGSAPLLGMGEGGPQFDKRGSVDEMKNGQGGYHQRVFGARVPIPWVIGTSGWALFFHQPEGKFDFTGEEAAFLPSHPAGALDVFVTSADEPSQIMSEYARLTGFPAMPPLWSFGYQQSHRTLASREEVMSVAATFREKKLPCDALIYLGTGFCPSGWNTGHGSFTFNKAVFPDPGRMISELHQEHFHVVLHTVFREKALHGTVRDRCDPSANPAEEVSCYWDTHRKVFALGVDGWWPDEGDGLNAASRLARNRMYWDGPQLDRPNVRPYALNRNAAPGSQRYGAFLWSGDVSSTWETLRTHIPVAINTGLSGLPYWGTDTGGFVPTKELTGELYVRWFQFSAFCPLFRSHGRTWKLRLPWQWNTGELGPSEAGTSAGAADPDVSELHNAAVEPICRKYLDLRYQLMPYLYSLVRECHRTCLPLMRALWLHYPNDPVAVARGDEYLWGRDILVAPVTEKGAASRKLYLPAGDWHDFWTGEVVAGAREIVRPVNLETMPLYVRAGGVIPFGPVRQYIEEKVDEPLTLTVYPGADGDFVLYEDDGVSFDFEHGAFTELRCQWNDRARELLLSTPKGSKARSPRPLLVRVAPSQETRRVVFEGAPLRVRLG
ncbi:MAG TPA: TIM-barrel domain-containing protein [Bryobacteraceae bacterium]|nr:TIM-barrel domain-containing protein [Bryobacteraceae bacterium]